MVVRKVELVLFLSHLRGGATGSHSLRREPVLTYTKPEDPRNRPLHIDGKQAYMKQESHLHDAGGIVGHLSSMYYYIIRSRQLKRGIAASLCTGVKTLHPRHQHSIAGNRNLTMSLYDGKTFRSASNTANGEVGAETLFHYHQDGNIVWAEYGGGSIVRGTLIATVTSADNSLDMRYQHVNREGELMTGQCRSKPEVLDDGRLRMHEKWMWTSGDRSEGESVIEEVKKE